MKKNKIIDIIFVGDNEDVLNFRIKELYDYIDNFIIINHNESGYQNNDSKVRILKTGPIDFNTFEPQPHLNDILEECLKDLDMRLEDIIMVSNYNEIPDLEFLDEIIQELTYNPIYLEHIVFNWSFNYVSVERLKGTYIFDFAFYLRDYERIERLMKYKNKNFFMGNTIKNGWCLLGFDYENHDEKLYQNRIPVNFENPLVSYQLLESTDVKLPKNYDFFGKINLDRTTIKKIVFSDEQILNENDFDYIVYLNFIDEWSELKINEVTQNIFRVTSYVPKFTLYGDTKKFIFNFKLNEIKRIIDYLFILNQDVIEINLENIKLKFTWGNLKNENFSEKLL